MPTKPSLQTLIELAQGRSDTAARKLGALNSRQLENAEKLKLLLQFRADYETQYLESARRGMGSAGLSNFQQFLIRLEQAIAQQEQALAKLNAQRHNSEVEWQASRREFKAYDTLSRRYAAAEAREQQRREQRQCDEHALRKPHRSTEDQ
jgi:flagellar FliJ protein